MLKKVKLTNIYNGRSSEVIVDANDDAQAIFGAGKAPNETAEVTDITGADETDGTKRSTQTDGSDFHVSHVWIIQMEGRENRSRTLSPPSKNLSIAV